MRELEFLKNLSTVLGHSLWYETKQKYSPNGEADGILCVSTFSFTSDNGTATSDPPRGTTSTDAITQFNWKNADDAVATAYSAAPITAGNNSFERFIYGTFTGSYNQITNGLWQHVSGVLGAGLVVKVVVTGTGAGSYTTPATTTNANLTRDLTQTGLITTGLTVLFGASGAYASGKNASTSAVPAFSQYLVSQLQTTVAASAGDTTNTTWTLRYDEN